MRAPLNRATWIGYASADGIVRASADGSLEGASVAGEDWFSGGLTETTIGQANVANAGTTEPSVAVPHVVDIGVPVRDQTGKVVGVLGIYLGQAWTDRLRSSTVGSRDPGTGIELIVMRADGEILVGQEAEPVPVIPQVLRQRMVEQKSGLLPNQNDNFISAFAVADPIEGDGDADTWLVIARQNADAAFGAASRVTTIVVAFGLAAALAGVAGAAMIAGRVSQPFRKLAEGAERMNVEGGGNLPRVHGSAEAVRLSSTLDALIHRLRDARRVTTELEETSAAEHLRLNRDIATLRNLTEVDPLTGLLNRRRFMEIAAEAVEHYRRFNHSFALLLLDIDHFKRVNDTLGHAAGDEALRAVAATLTGILRPDDRAGRLGGEEFVVLLRETDYAGGLEAAERVRRTIEATTVTSREGNLSLTVSIGLAVCTLGDATIEDLVQRADIALYAAKSGGRNRVALAPVTAAEVQKRA